MKKMKKKKKKKVNKNHYAAALIRTLDICLQSPAFYPLDHGALLEADARLDVLHWKPNWRQVMDSLTMVSEALFDGKLFRLALVTTTKQGLITMRLVDSLL